MANRTSKVMQQLRKAVLLPGGAGLTDGQLLGRFIEGRDEAAFAALVKRHGPMVYGVCRRLLTHHDAEDAFQAAFLVLARKAASVVPREMVGNWLYGVAHQAALQGRRLAARRGARERQVAEMPEPAVAEQDLWRDLRPLLDLELSRMPDKYRAVVVLCDVEGRPRKEVARQLGCPEGTVAGRLARARGMLASRLARHGLTVVGGALAAALSQNAASADVPAAAVSSTIKAAGLFAAGQGAATGVISAEVAALTEGVLKAMLLNKLRATAVVLLVVLAGLTACGLIHRTEAADPAREKQQAQIADAAKVKQGQVAGPMEGKRTQGLNAAEPVNPDKMLSCSEVVAAFDANEAAGDEEFIGKRVRVTGKVARVERVALTNKAFLSNLPESDTQYYLLTLRSELNDEKKNAKKSGASYNPDTAAVAFVFPKSGRTQLAGLQRGQQVAVEGVCQGRSGAVLFNVTFTACEVVKGK